MAGSAYRIFLSYRRSDAGGYAGWLHQLLADRFPDGEVFRDVDSLRAGERWVDRLEETLARCNVVIAVIGPDWLAVENERGRRLEDPEDRVRLELEAGLRRSVPVIPALVGGAQMPPRERLPPALAPLCDWQSVRLSDESWRRDVDTLIEAIERALTAAPGELQVGSTFAGHEIEALIGRGGMGIVYRARHLGLGRVDAIKVIAPELARGAEFRERFVRESQLAAAIRHEHLLTVYDAGEEGGLFYLVMQLVDGSDLAALIAREPRPAARRAAALLEPIADALSAAHAAGLVHRDVKPGNILVEGAAGAERTYLADFGLARETTTASGLTGSGRWIGTADYVAPEQVMGEPTDARADVYALGCVLYQMLAGRVPYPERSETAKLVAHATRPPTPIAELRPDLDADAIEAVTTAMARDPAARYPSAAAMRDALAALAGGIVAAPAEARDEPTAARARTTEPAAAPPPRPPGALRPWWRRPATALAVLAIAIIAAVSAILASSGGGGGHPPADATTHRTTTSSTVSSHSAAAPTASAQQLMHACVAFYAGDLSNLDRNCAKIGSCFATHMHGVTISQFEAVARHNLSGGGSIPPRYPQVENAEHECDSVLPRLSAYVDGTAGDT